MNRIKDIGTMLKERRVGFQMNEIMSGEHEFEPGCGPAGKHPFEFQVTWGPKDLLAWLNPYGDSFFKQPLAGTVSVGGWKDKIPCRGTLTLDYFKAHHIQYQFFFTHEQTKYRFVGEKVNIRPWNLPVSHTTCFGVLTDVESGRLISKSLTYFKLKTLPSFLWSLRLA